MKAPKKWSVLAVIVAAILSACMPASTPTTAPAAISTEAPTTGTPYVVDPQNATYLIDGKEVTLVDGVAEQEAAPGSASKIVTKYFGNAVNIDLNSDGLMDFRLPPDTGRRGKRHFLLCGGGDQSGRQHPGNERHFPGRPDRPAVHECRSGQPGTVHCQLCRTESQRSHVSPTIRGGFQNVQTR